MNRLSEDQPQMTIAHATDPAAYTANGTIDITVSLDLLTDDVEVVTLGVVEICRMVKEEIRTLLVSSVSVFPE